MAAPGLDGEAFTAMFPAAGRALWVVAAAWVGRDEAADVVQEAARVAWQRRSQFRPGSDGKAWLSQIVRHVAANWRRRRRPELRAPELLDAESARERQRSAEWPFDAEACDLPDAWVRALQKLSEVARACLLLSVVLELSFAEIGGLLEIPENTAASHARRARLQVREALSADPEVAPAPLRKVP